MSHLIVHALSPMCKYKHHHLLRRKRQEVASWSAAADAIAHSQMQRTSVVESSYSEARFGQANGRIWSGPSALHPV